MSVHPTTYAGDGSINVWHDEADHGGVVTFADVRFARNADNSVNALFITLACPVCGAVSMHPVGGGSHPALVQKLFLRTFLRRAAALGLAADFPTIKAYIKARVQAMDGAARWKLEHMNTEDDPETPTQ